MPSTRKTPARTRLLLAAFMVLLGVSALGACGSPGNPEVLGGGSGPNDASTGGGCPGPGCPCSTSGATMACGYVKEQSGSYVTCAEGSSTCTNGAWSPCVADHTTFQSSAPVGGGLRLQGLGLGGTTDAGNTNCVSSPCDPSCQTYVDSSSGLDAGSGLLPTDAGGWTLPGEGGVGLDAATQCFVTLTGTVYDPAALEPVYNAVVAIPYTGSPVGSGSPPPIPTGVPVTDACGGAGFSALRSAITDVHGNFSLPGVPVQSAVTLVTQIGRWRRVQQVNTSACGCGGTIDISPGASTSTCLGTVGGCAGAGNYAGTSSCLTSLPRTQSGGVGGSNNIPRTAITTGACDPEECLLYRMGVASSEFTDETGTGRVNVFYGHGAGLPGHANHTLAYLEGFSSGLQDGGFEASGAAGALSGWYSGANGNGWVGVGSGGAYQGSYWGAVGPSWWGTGQVGFDYLSQTFTAPPGTTTLSYHYYPACSGGTEYFQASLVDVTAGTTTSSPQVCQSNVGWIAGRTFALTAGHTYTMNFINHDDGGGSGTAIDGVTLNAANSAPPSLLDNYDLVMLPCDCGLEYNHAWGINVDEPGRVNLVNYANGGGRIFSSHWGREWIERVGTTLTSGPFPGVANWITDNGGNGSTGQIVTGTSYGNAFNAWMTSGATPAPGSSFAVNPWRQDTSGVTSASRLFVTYDGSNGTTSGYPADFTFDTPLGGTALGRAMYTDMHLATGNLNPGGADGPAGQGIGTYTFPSECPAQGSVLSSQELAAEYLLFDLGNCVSGQPVPGSYPPVTTTGNGTNSTCSGGTSKDLIPTSCTTDADCEMDFHCASGACVWSQGSGYFDPACTTSSGAPGVDLTIGVPCGNAAGYDIPICNRGGGTLASGSIITIENSGNGGSPSAPWNCAAPPTPNPPSVSGGAASCTYKLPIALGPGECTDIDTTTAAGAACSVLEVGERYLYINYDQSIPECGTGFSGAGPGCMNNTTHTKTTGSACPAVCGGSTTYAPATFTRDFDATCPSGFVPVWHLFTWNGVTPSTSSLDFQAWTADTQPQLGVQFPTSATLEQPAPDSHANGYVDNQNYSTDVDTRLIAAGYPTSGNPLHASHTWLRVNMILTPSTDLQSAPTLNSWNQTYDCVSAE